MGLDITAYRRLTPVKDPTFDEYGESITGWQPTASTLALTEQYYPGRSHGIAPVVYDYEGDPLCFRAGSYGGYNQWRDMLAKLAGHGSAENVWSATQPVGPFVELIDFSDCEGVIGPTVAAKLAKDFAVWQTEFERTVGPDYYDWFIRRYRLWRQAFEMAADGGAVHFH